MYCLPQRYFPVYFRSSPVPGSPRGRKDSARLQLLNHVDYLCLSSVIDSQTAKPKESCFVSVLVNVGTECRRVRRGRRGQSSGQNWSLFSQRGERKRGLLEKGALHPSCSYYNNANHTCLFKSSHCLLPPCGHNSSLQCV